MAPAADKKLTGLVAATFTPLTQKGEINLSEIGPYIDYLREKQGVNSIFVNGTTGESMSLSVGERKILAEEWCHKAKAKMDQVIVHVGCMSLKDSQELLGRDLQQYQSQAKQLFRKLNDQSPTRCTLEAGSMAFHYFIEKGVVYLVLCEASFPKKLAFAYLEDLQAEFHEQHGKKVPTVSRPYSFIEFDTYIQKTKKSYIDSRARRNLGSINTELQDVQRIMVANIEEVLQRGEALSALDSKASNLSSLSKKYRSDAKYLNTRSTYAKLAAGGVFFIMLIVYVRFWWL
ncbi:putative vesicle-trafficking protein SEC22b-like [Scophthalmus maximus]|uniref:Putative vesicle-trafficking protein SEC22b-like n=1 Tax=Scophthalmus maximus TaxID=52904 RepID=A0A2U9C3V2_SCOMX|nr:putative vesicle-trafficking protein SEC22b-like [Scophthalmus maximus]